MASCGQKEALECDEHNMWQPELIKKERRKFWFRLLEFSLYIHDLDPYAIFKRDQQQHANTKQKRWMIRFDNNFDRLGNSQLRMQTTNRDKFRHKITLPLRLFSTYILIKVAIIAIAQHTLLRYEHLVPNSGHSQPLMDRASALWIASHLGMPYYALKDISLAFISTSAGFFFVCAVVLPLYYRRYPMNISQLRFLLDPRHELKRVDASVRRRLTSIRNSLDVYTSSKLATYKQRHLASRRQHRRQQHAYRKQWHRLGQGDEINELAHRELQYCHQIKEHLREFGKCKSFRPDVFTPRAHMKLVGRTRLLVLGSLVSYVSGGVLFSACLYYPAHASKCPQLDCNFFRALTWPELLVILETLTIIVFLEASSLLNTTLFEMLALCQLDLIESVKMELAVCHRRIAEFVYSTRGDTNRGAAAAPVRAELERLMLKSIVRLTICDQELKENARCITEQTVQPACYLAAAVIFAAISVQFKLPASSSLRWIIVAALWITVNVAAVSCANIHARVLSFQRQLWSVLAVSSRLLANNYFLYHGEQVDSDTELAQHARLQFRLGMPLRGHKLTFGEWRRQSRDEGGRCDGVCCSFVADLWHKFVLSTSSNVEQHYSRLLNMELSYEKIIEANFFSIFIYSLTLGHDK